MTSNPKPGMLAVYRFISDGKDKSQGTVCYDIANEIWIRINTLEADSKKPVSKRMRKTERERYLTTMTGLKLGLHIALGLSYSYEGSTVDAFLNAFQQERLAESRKASNRTNVDLSDSPAPQVKRVQEF